MLFMIRITIVKMDGWAYLNSYNHCINNDLNLHFFYNHRECCCSNFFRDELKLFLFNN